MLLKWLWENTAAPLVYDVITGQLLHCWSLIKTKLSSGGYGLSRPLQLTRAGGDKQICLFFWSHLPHAALWSVKHGPSPHRWALTERDGRLRCVLETQAMHQTGCAWPPGASLGTLPRGRITTDTAQPLGLSVLAQTCRIPSIFTAGELQAAIVYQPPTRIYWNNKPQSFARTRLSLLTVIFMFTPLNANRSESGRRVTDHLRET